MACGHGPGCGTSPSTVQSLLFRVMSWRFAQWHDDAGAALAANQQFEHLRATPEELRSWHAIFGVLLINRNAVHRYASGVGTYERVRELMNLAIGTRRSPATLWSIRLLSEYLNLYGRRNSIVSPLEEEFERVWRVLEQSPSLEPDGSLVCLESSQIWTDIPRPPHLDIHGLAETRELFDEFVEDGKSPSSSIFARLLAF